MSAPIQLTPPPSTPDPWPIRERLRAHGALLTGPEEALALGEYRRIKRPLLRNAYGSELPTQARAPLVMITSALPGEGKTYTAINLALSMASEVDLSVLLIDADVLKRDVSRILGLEGHLGLMDLLTDPKLLPEQLILPTEIPGLSVLPAGRPSSLSTELFSSRGMSSLLDRLLQMHPRCMVLLDSPPLLATVEAQILGGLAGQVAMVVEAMRTPQDALLDALGKLDAQQTVGLIFNKGSKLQDSYYYGSYYGYGYYQPEVPNAEATLKREDSAG